ncbi:conserved hypothetical protein [Streptomyces clavuligerus]|nr:conserved hypothetical protein [Streptomyces clavuligerus]
MWSTTGAERKVAHEVEARWGELLAEVDTGAAERDATGRPVPSRFLGRAGALGLQAMPLPPEAGGSGADPLTWSLILEEIGYRCQDTGFSLILGIRAAVVRALWETGRPDVVERYVRPAARGELGTALAYSEDADAFSFRTTLRRTPGGYVLDGLKDFVTGGTHADVFLVYARDGATDDLAGCLVHRTDPGVTVRALDPVGTRTSGAAALELRSVPLVPERVVVPTDGLSHAQRLLNARRLTVCGAPIGRARALVEHAAARVNAAHRHGRPLSDLPNVQAALGRMYIAVEAARALLYRAAARVADGQADPMFDPLVSAAKHLVVDRVRSVLEEALQTLGGHFYYGEPYFGTCLRDFAGLVAVAGTQDLLAVNLGTLTAAHCARSTPSPDSAPSP